MLVRLVNTKLSSKELQKRAETGSTCRYYFYWDQSNQWDAQRKASSTAYSERQAPWKEGNVLKWAGSKSLQSLPTWLVVVPISFRRKSGILKLSAMKKPEYTLSRLHLQIGFEKSDLMEEPNATREKWSGTLFEAACHKGWVRGSKRARGLRIIGTIYYESRRW